MSGGDRPAHPREQAQRSCRVIRAGRFLEERARVGPVPDPESASSFLRGASSWRSGSSCLWPAAARSGELAVAPSTTPDSKSRERLSDPSVPSFATPNPLVRLDLGAFRKNVPSAGVCADNAAFCPLVHSAAVLLIEIDSISAIGPNLGTKWEQHWQYQPNAATMYVRQGSIVTALQSKPLSTTATCF